MKVALAYLETFWALPGVPGKDPYADLRVAADLPLGLATVRAFVESDRALAAKLSLHNRVFTDGVPEADAARELLALKPDLAAFTVFLWSAPRTFGLIARLKALRPGLRVVVGGPEVPRASEALRAFLAARPELDFAVCGEGEETFAELLRALSGRTRRFDKIAGLGWRNEGVVTVNAPRPPRADLAGVPSPYASGAVAVRAGRAGMLCLETSRGCPLACSYCDYHAGRRGMRLFELERLESELAALKAAGFSGSIYLTDPYLNIKRERTLAVFAILARQDNRFLMELRPETFDDEMIAALGRIPCATVSLGVQSVNPVALRNANRPFDQARCSRNLRKILRFANIRVELELILGLPGDDYEAFKRTLDWALGFAPQAHLTLFDLVMLPNAPLAAQVERFGIRADAEGLVSETSSFSAEDMARSSRLFAAYCRLRDTPGCWDGFAALLGKGGRPSEHLERVAEGMLRAGLLPSERVIGQGGRRGAPGAAAGVRWVDLSRARTGVESGGWW